MGACAICSLYRRRRRCLGLGLDVCNLGRLCYFLLCNTVAVAVPVDGVSGVRVEVADVAGVASTSC